MGLIDTVFRRINLVVGVWVCRKRLWVYDFVRKTASDDKCVLDCEKKNVRYQFAESGISEERYLRTPTTSHWPSESKRKSNFPRSWMSPVTCIHSGLPSRRMASAVWSRCSICDKSV